MSIIYILQTTNELIEWADLITVAPVVGALALWIIYLIRQNSELTQQIKKEREEWASERKELNSVFKDMTDVIDRAHNAIESGNISIAQNIKSEAEGIRLRLQNISDKIDTKS